MRLGVSMGKLVGNNEELYKKVKSLEVQFSYKDILIAEKEHARVLAFEVRVEKEKIISRMNKENYDYIEQLEAMKGVLEERDSAQGGSEARWGEENENLKEGLRSVTLLAEEQLGQIEGLRAENERLVAVAAGSGSSDARQNWSNDILDQNLEQNQVLIEELSVKNEELLLLNAKLKDSLNCTNRVLADRNLEIGEIKIEAMLTTLELEAKEQEISKMNSQQELPQSQPPTQTDQPDQKANEIKIQNLEHEIQRLKDFLADKEKLESESEDKGCQLEKLKVEVKSLETELASHKILLQEIGGKNSKLVMGNSDLTKELKLKTKSLATFTEVEKSLKHENSQLDLANKDLSSQLGNLEQNLQFSRRDVETLEQKNSSLIPLAKSHEQTIKKNQSELANLISEKADLCLELENLKSAQKNIAKDLETQKNSHAEEIITKSTSYEKKIEEYQSEIQNLSAEIKKLLREMEELKGLLYELKANQ